MIRKNTRQVGVIKAVVTLLTSLLTYGYEFYINFPVTFTWYVFSVTETVGYLSGVSCKCYEPIAEHFLCDKLFFLITFYFVKFPEHNVVSISEKVVQVIFDLLGGNLNKPCYLYSININAVPGEHLHLIFIGEGLCSGLVNLNISRKTGDSFLSPCSRYPVNSPSRLVI